MHHSSHLLWQSVAPDDPLFAGRTLPRARRARADRGLPRRRRCRRDDPRGGRRRRARRRLLAARDALRVRDPDAARAAAGGPRVRAAPRPARMSPRDAARTAFAAAKRGRAGVGARRRGGATRRSARSTRSPGRPRCGRSTGTARERSCCPTTSTAGCASTSPAARRAGSCRPRTTPEPATSCPRRCSRRGAATAARSSSASCARRTPSAGARPRSLADLVVHWDDAAYDDPVSVAGSGIVLRPDARRLTGRHTFEGFLLSAGMAPPGAVVRRPRAASGDRGHRERRGRRAAGGGRARAALPGVRRGRSRLASARCSSAAAARPAIRSSTGRHGCWPPRARPPGEAAVARRTAVSFAYEWERFGALRDEWARNFADYLRPHDAGEPRGQVGARRRLRLRAPQLARRRGRRAGRRGRPRRLDRRRAAQPAAVGADRAGRRRRRCRSSPGSFDLVMSIGVLHHLPDTERALRSIARYAQARRARPRLPLLGARATLAPRRAAARRRASARDRAAAAPRAARAVLSARGAAARRVRRFRSARCAAGRGAGGSRRRCPLKTYADYPFGVLVNDQFDRFSRAARTALHGRRGARDDGGRGPRGGRRAAPTTAGSPTGGVPTSPRGAGTAPA